MIAQFQRRCPRLAAFALFIVVAAFATPATSLGGLKRFETTYRVTYSGIELGEFKASARFDGANYAIEGKGEFKILEGLLFNWNGKTAAAGSIADDGPHPSAFVFNYSTNRKNEQLRINYDGAAVRNVEIVPAWTPDPEIVPVRKSQLVSSLDPLSAVFLLGRASEGKDAASLCTQTIPVFDGRQRFDLKLSHKKTVQVKNDGPAKYSGPVVVCRVRYSPISGHDPGDDGTIHLAKSSDIEVWLVPLPNASLYVPYAIHLPTLGGGYASAMAISFASTPAPRRAALEASGSSR